MTQDQRDQLNTIMANSTLDLGGDVTEQRVILNDLLTSHSLPSDVNVQPVSLGGVAALSVQIVGHQPQGTILYFHGGVFAMGSAQASLGLASELGRRAHMRVITVDYRLAPDNPYPAAADDAFAAYRGLLAIEGDATKIALVGESAGGNLALITLLGIRDATLPMPFAAVLMSPWTDLAVIGDSATTKADVDPALTVRALQTRAKDYLREVDPASAEVSPIHADLTGLPPLLIQVGSHEILLDDAIRLAAKAAADDVQVILDVTPQVPHVFQAFAAILDEGHNALNRAAVFLRSNTTSLG
jgi:monoterpene epsilon-lactone hydrolase